MSVCMRKHFWNLQVKIESNESDDILNRFNQLSESELIFALGPFQPVQEIGKRTLGTIKKGSILRLNFRL